MHRLICFKQPAAMLLIYLLSQCCYCYLCRIILPVSVLSSGWFHWAGICSTDWKDRLSLCYCKDSLKISNGCLGSICWLTKWGTIFWKSKITQLIDFSELNQFFMEQISFIFEIWFGLFWSKNKNTKPKASCFNPSQARKIVEWCLSGLSRYW